MINLQKGDVILVKDKTFYNWIVRKFTSSNWGHAVLYIGESKYIEATGDGVKIMSLSTLEKKEMRVYRHKRINQGIADEVVLEAITYEGKGYDFKAIAKMLFLVLCRRGRGTREIGNTAKYICSELVATPYQKKGLHIIKNVSASQTLPNDFDLSPYFIRIEDELLD